MKFGFGSVPLRMQPLGDTVTASRAEAEERQSRCLSAGAQPSACR